MGVRLTDLHRALQAQVPELTAAEWAALPESVPQQLMHHDATSGRPATGLGVLMAERLRRVTAATGRLGLATRWSTARARPRLRSRSGAVTALAVSADGSRVVFAGQDELWQWTPEAEEPGPLPLGRVGAPITALDLSADGLRAVTADAAGTIHSWALGLRGTGPVRLGAHRRFARSVVLPEDGRAVSVGDDGRVMRWPTPGAEAAPAGETPAEAGLCLATLEQPLLTAVVVLGGYAVVGARWGRLWRCAALPAPSPWRGETSAARSHRPWSRPGSRPGARSVCPATSCGGRRGRWSQVC